MVLPTSLRMTLMYGAGNVYVWLYYTVLERI